MNAGVIILGVIACSLSCSSALYVSNLACNVLSTGNTFCFTTRGPPGPPGPTGPPGQTGAIGPTVNKISLNGFSFNQDGYTTTTGATLSTTPSVLQTGTPSTPTSPFAATPVQCAAACAANTACIGWQVDGSGNCTQYQHGNDTQYGYESGLALTAGMVYANFPSTLTGTSAPGSYADPQSCLTACTNSPNCEGWTHGNQNAPTANKNSCTLFTGSGASVSGAYTGR